MPRRAFTNYIREKKAMINYCSSLFQVDGLIARKFKDQKSKLGSILDPLADKILVTTLFISLSLMDQIPGQKHFRKRKSKRKSKIIFPSQIREEKSMQKDRKICTHK